MNKRQRRKALALFRHPFGMTRGQRERSKDLRVDDPGAVRFRTKARARRIRALRRLGHVPCLDGRLLLLYADDDWETAHQLYSRPGGWLGYRGTPGWSHMWVGRTRCRVLWPAEDGLAGPAYSEWLGAALEGSQRWVR